MSILQSFSHANSSINLSQNPSNVPRSFLTLSWLLLNLAQPFPTYKAIGLHHLEASSQRSKTLQADFNDIGIENEPKVGEGVAEPVGGVKRGISLDQG